MLERGQRCRAGAAVVAGDQHHVGVGLRDAGRDRADADRADQLDVDSRFVVGVLEVVDELREVLDRVDVVVRRRRDQSDTRRGMPCLGDVRVHLEARKLTTFTGFGALSHLDLDVGGIDKVVAGDAEPSRCDLLHRAAPFVGHRGDRRPRRPHPSWTGPRWCSSRWPWSRGLRRRSTRSSWRRC